MARALLLVLALTLTLSGVGGAALDCAVPAVAATEIAGPGGDGSSGAARTQLVHVSYALCAVSAQCRRRFSLWDGVGGLGAPDWRFFGYLVDRLVDEMRIDTVAVAAALCGGDAVEAAAMLWRLVLDNYSFCTENEVPDPVAGCICRRDKVCHETPGEDYAYGRATLALVVLAFLCAILYYGPRAINDVAELRRAVALAALPAVCDHTCHGAAYGHGRTWGIEGVSSDGLGGCSEIGLSVSDARLRSVAIELGMPHTRARG